MRFPIGMGRIQHIAPTIAVIAALPQFEVTRRHLELRQAVPPHRTLRRRPRRHQLRVRPDRRVGFGHGIRDAVLERVIRIRLELR